MSKEMREQIDRDWKQFLAESILQSDNIISFELAKILKEKRFHKPTDLFYTWNGKISNEFYASEYKKNKVPRADWNACTENSNAKPWYRFGFSAIKKALENF